MCFIIERPLCQFVACHCRDDACFWAIMRLKRRVRTLALLAGVYEVNVFRVDSTDTCTTTS
jgi:hypothetical protein